MQLLGKNLPLEETLTNMSNVFKKLDLKSTLSTELHPLKNCFSHNLSFDGAKNYIYSNGKGINHEASLASAYGEFIERLQTNNFFSDFYLPNQQHFPDEVLFEMDDFLDTAFDKKLKKIYDPNNELSGEDLIDFNSSYGDKIVTLPFTNLMTKQIVHIPQNFISNLYVSNGLASGNTPNEAKVQALSEIMERYVKIKVIKEALSLPTFDKALLEKFDKLSEDIEILEANGYTIAVHDATLGGVYPVVAISLINPKNSTLFVSFGAHPILEVALERTMSELMQGRDLNKLDSFETPTFDMQLVDDSSNIESHFVDSNGKIGFGFLSAKKSFPLTPWRYAGANSEDEYKFLVNILNHEKKEIFLREYDYLGFYSCQIIVPNFSEVYPIEDLIYNNKNQAKMIREMVLNFKDYDYEEILDAILPLDNSIDIGKYIGVIFETPFTMLEFKAQIHILLDELEEARELLFFSDKKLSLVVGEIILMENENLQFNDFKEGLFTLFGEDFVQKAIQIVAGEDFLIDVTFHLEYENILALYDKLTTYK
ncbi:MAG: YcaO-like family protein [Arcobacteraceae bacterium]|jgi:ribosomal protein S12 methylthiotransferase accessory factor|nr:YcaO-like family protein [Arcobacteraceae bacterium]